MRTAAKDVRLTTENRIAEQKVDHPIPACYSISTWLGDELRRVEADAKAEADRKRQDEIERLRAVASFD